MIKKSLIILFLAVLCVSLGSQTVAAVDIYEIVELGGLYHAHDSGSLVWYDGEYLRILSDKNPEVFEAIKSTGREDTVIIYRHEFLFWEWYYYYHIYIN